MRSKMVATALTAQVVFAQFASAEEAATTNFTSTSVTVSKALPPNFNRSVTDDRSDYSNWKIVSYDNRTFILQTESCEYTISPMPSLSSFAARIDYNHLKDTLPGLQAEAFRASFAQGFVRSFLAGDYVSGSLPANDITKIDWSKLSIRAQTEGNTPDDYNFAGILTSPRAISLYISSGADQPSCSADRTKAILIGRDSNWQNDGSRILFYVFDFDLDGNEKDAKEIDLYFCVMKKDHFSEKTWNNMTDVGWAFAKALVSHL